RIEPNTLGASNLGTHIHATEPSGARRAETSPSLRKPWSPIGTARARPMASVRASAASVDIPAGSTGVGGWASGVGGPARGRASYADAPEGAQRPAQIGHLEHGHPVDSPTPGLGAALTDRRDRHPEPEPGRLGEALRQVSDLADLAGQADLAE